MTAYFHHQHDISLNNKQNVSDNPCSLLRSEHQQQQAVYDHQDITEPPTLATHELR